MAALAVQAHEPITTKLTWTQEISRIVYKRCASCHHEGGAAFSLMAYDDARPWAKAIRDEVLERRMPPWGAVEGIRTYRDNSSLTPVEVEMIVSWVEGGAPEGDIAYLPPAPLLQGVQSTRTPAPVLTIRAGKPLALEHATTATGVTPRDLPDGTSMEVTAYRPDGGVEHLIWLRNYRDAWSRTYRFQDPVALPAGTRVVVDAPISATAVISISAH